MTTQQAEPLQVDPTEVGTLELGGAEVPYVDLEGAPYIHSRLAVGGTEYGYERTFPIKGHSAVMPAAVAELQAKGKRILVAERGERYYLFTG